jgi:hypothetical protein
MIKQLGLVLVFLVSYNTLYSQISLEPANLDISIKEELLMHDTSTFHLMQIPLLNFDIEMYSNPGVFTFFETTDNSIIIDLDAYSNHVDYFASHLVDIQNSLFYYALEHRQSIYSFGINHRFFLDASLSNELVSLLVDGNYQYLNQTIDLDNNNYINLSNYFSLFFGYTKRINEQFLLSTKLKLIKGVSELGVNNQNSSFLFNDNFETVHNPFSSEINADVESFVNSDYNLSSNLGFATDLYLDYNYNETLSFYTKVSDLGFIMWEENQYSSLGYFQFDGLDYELDQVLSSEFNNLQDTLMDIFDIKESLSVQQFRILPFNINLGIKYVFDNKLNQISASYTIQKLFNNLLHTGCFSYVHYFNDYSFSLIPSYSFNKFNYTNFSIMLNKRWQNRFYTNFYLDNMLGFIDRVNNRNIGFGVDFFILF